MKQTKVDWAILDKAGKMVCSGDPEMQELGSVLFLSQDVSLMDFVEWRKSLRSYLDFSRLSSVDKVCLKIQNELWSRA